MSAFHICLRPKGGVKWMGGMLYTENLAKAVMMQAAAENVDVKISMPGRYIDKVLLKLSKIAADRVRILPTELLNPWRYDFVYPDVAGARAPYRYGVWIPDLQEIHLPELFPQQEIDYRVVLYRQAAAAAPAIVLSSEMAKTDFLNLHPEARSRCHVLNFASCPAPEWTKGKPAEVQAKYGLPDRFFLVSNQFWKHKDHGTVIEAMSILHENGKCPTVVCTGGTEDYRNPDYFPELKSRITGLGLDAKIHILGLIPRLDQIQLMRGCLAVIQPSLFEGWSTVVEDARALGKQILLSDFPVHIEQNPPGARYFRRGDAEDLAAVMQDADAELVPGSDAIVESDALRTAEEQTQACGKKFLDIARGAVSEPVIV